MKPQLVLSIFPGIDLLGRAFEEEWPDACIVRGPDPLWGGDIHRFHPPAGVFSGLIGGDPCQPHGPLARFNASRGRPTQVPDLTHEFARVVLAAQTTWFLRENVRGAPDPATPGYTVSTLTLNNRDCGGEQDRVRKLWFGLRGETALDLWRFLELEPLRSAVSTRAVLASAGQRQGPHGALRTRRERRLNQPRQREPTYAQACTLQGLPPDFSLPQCTKSGAYHLIGQGVPLFMGRALARAIRLALADLQP